MCCAYGTASCFKKSLKDGPGNAGKGSSEFRNVLSWNFSMRYCFSLGTLAAVGGYGIFSGLGGGGERFTGSSCSEDTASVVCGIGIGKQDGKMFMSMQALLLK